MICFCKKKKKKNNYDGPRGSWCSRLLQVLVSESHETNNIHGVSSNQFTMLSIGILTCWDMELNNAILRQTGQIMLLLATQGAIVMHTVIYDPPLVTLVSDELRRSLSVAPMQKMIQTLPMRTCRTNNKSASRQRGRSHKFRAAYDAVDANGICSEPTWGTQLHNTMLSILKRSYFTCLKLGTYNHRIWFSTLTPIIHFPYTKFWIHITMYLKTNVNRKTLKII